MSFFKNRNFLLHTELQNTEVGSVIIRTNAYQHFRAFFFFFFFPPNIAGSHTFFFLLFRKIFSQYIYFHVYMHLHWKAYIICVQPLLQGAAGTNWDTEGSLQKRGITSYCEGDRALNRLSTEVVKSSLETQ